MIIGKIVFWVIIVYLAMCGGLFMSQRSMMYFPDQEFPDIPPTGGADFIRVVAADGVDIYGWYRVAEQDEKTIIYFHGNAGNIAGRYGLAQDFIKEHYGVVLAEYRGYAGNNGTPSEEGLYEDARAYINFLKGRGVEEKDMIFYGESLGSGVAIQMATEYPDVAGLMLITPFANMVDVAKSKYFFVPVDLLLKDRYLNDQKIAQLTMPKFFFAAGRDEVIGPQQAKALFDAAPEPKKWHLYPDATHNGIYDFGAERDLLAALNTL